MLTARTGASPLGSGSSAAIRRRPAYSPSAKIDDEATAAIQRGWYLGKETFKDRLLKLLDKAAQPAGTSRNRTGEALREHGEKEAERIVRRSLKSLQLASATKALAELPKSDRRKAAVALLLRERTTVSNGWIAARLSMGHPGSVSRMLGACKSDVEIALLRSALEKEIDHGGKKSKK